MNCLINETLPQLGNAVPPIDKLMVSPQCPRFAFLGGSNEPQFGLLGSSTRGHECTRRRERGSLPSPHALG